MPDSGTLATATDEPEVAGRRARVVEVLRWAVLAGVLGYAAYRVYADHDALWRVLSTISWPAAVSSLLALVAGGLVNARAWQVLVDDLGAPVGFRRAAPIVLLGTIAKYLPGQLWAYLLQIDLGRRAGLARGRVLSGSLMLFGIGAVAAVLTGALALPTVLPASWPLLLLVPVGLAVLHPTVLTWAASLVLRIVRWPRPDGPLRGATVARVVTLSTLTWVLLGVHLWLLTRSAGSGALAGPVLCTAAMALGMTLGDLAFVLPSGLGAREGVLVGMLVLVGLNAAQAIAFAAASRVLFVVADLINAAIAGLLALNTGRAQRTVR